MIKIILKYIIIQYVILLRVLHRKKMVIFYCKYIYNYYTNNYEN